MKRKISLLAPSAHQRKRDGFSLVECVIAIGLVAILLTTFMAIFVPTQQNINRALGVEDVKRLASTLENEMSTLRPGEEDAYKVGSASKASAFEKAFQWIKNSNDPTKAILMYQYQALPNTEYTVGSVATGLLEPVTQAIVTDESKVPGVDYITQSVARKLDDTFLKTSGSTSAIDAELAPGVIVGDVYAVKLTQLVKDSAGMMKPGKAGEIVSIADNKTQKTVTNSSAIENGYILFEAQFYRLPNNLANFVKSGGWTFESLGKPVLTQNIAVRR